MCRRWSLRPENLISYPTCETLRTPRHFFLAGIHGDVGIMLWAAFHQQEQEC